ncbi:Lrp/AsnC family transcriptional regulator [Lentilitoribacter sp. Alg239-R112]|uniref:Lrp/AsnC family transcriptional regulator n=1 Tax=Lentilitoribacter sp. Alg239-R112 TaxID=2305987 RepID=UPI0013A6A668|nr:Lrp/AsnC family transcriptional regulator [Lentilitoribacter sp. Alg239-R112]
MQLDNFDRRILAALQEDGSLTNYALSEMINLPLVDTTERRSKLEHEGVIDKYHAVVNRTASGFDVFAFIAVTLLNHDRRSAERFNEFLRRSPQVLEAHALTEDIDIIVKVAVSNLEELSSLVSDQIEKHDSVRSAKALMSLETIKETLALPL